MSASSQQFVERVRPHWAVISSGFRTDHQLPRPATLAWYSAAKANILRTDVLDEEYESEDDHLVLVMAEQAGDLVWRQVGTERLLEDVEE